MSNIANSLFARIAPFIGIGVFVVLLIVGLILVSYVIFWGALIGLALFAFSYVKNKIFPPKTISPPQQRNHTPKTYDHDQWH